MFGLEKSYIVTKDASNFNDVSDEYFKESKKEKSFNGLCFVSKPTSVGEVNKKISGPGSHKNNGSCFLILAAADIRYVKNNCFLPLFIHFLSLFISCPCKSFFLFKFV